MKTESNKGHRRAKLTAPQRIFIAEVSEVAGRLIEYTESVMFPHANIYGTESLAPSMLPLNMLVDVGRLFFTLQSSRDCDLCRAELQLDDEESRASAAAEAGYLALMQVSGLFLSMESEEPGNIWLPEDLLDAYEELTAEGDEDAMSEVVSEAMRRYAIRCAVEAAVRITELTGTRDKVLPELDDALVRGGGRAAFEPIKVGANFIWQLENAQGVIRAYLDETRLDAPPPDGHYH